MSGDEDDDSLDASLIDQRTRLYYTAKFSDNFEFVNKFEIDADWGDNTLGDLGADGISFEVKNSYVDFTLGSIRSTIGIQGATLARGFILGDDLSAAIIRYQPGTTQDLLVPFIWGKLSERDTNGDTLTTLPNIGIPQIAGDADVNLFGLYPYFPLGDFSLNPYFFYVHTDRGVYAESDWYYVGIDADAKFGDIGLWGSLIYNGGTLARNALTGDPADQGQDNDISGYLLAIGGDFPVGPLALRSQFFWASGQDLDDDLAAGDDVEAFVTIGESGLGSSYYWSEIMGLGIFDDNASAGSPGDHITNIWAFNVGTDFNITEGSKLAVDLWYASLVEDNLLGDSDLGFEIDLVYTVNLIENLNLELVGAYLFAGDAVTADGFDFDLDPALRQDNQDDPWILGTRLSFSF
jgi:hypothetical protein